MRRVVSGWAVAFLGIMLMVGTAIGTAIKSVSDGHFVWSVPQTCLLVGGGVLFIGGVIWFVVSSFRAVDHF